MIIPARSQPPLLVRLLIMQQQQQKKVGEDETFGDKSLKDSSDTSLLFVLSASVTFKCTVYASLHKHD